MIFAQGIIIEKKESGDADWKYIALTEELGKIEFLSRGGRKVLARLSGHIEPFSYTQLEFTPTTTLKLIGATVSHHFRTLNNNPVLFAIAYRNAQFVNQFLPFHYHDADLFQIFHTYIYDMHTLGENVVLSETEIRREAEKRTYHFLYGLGKQLGIISELQFSENTLQLREENNQQLLVRNNNLRHHLLSNL
ncbi:MAG: recombination protein O N-terminal domain-containing protein [Patescibacteria group bacterium]|nr:recombination protein O N-terminal domain-containing protein [Patescibacteria group bacterium]MDE2438838.1 recombination protein O N-terminal domain-containing protein [Patescibacteria group bacterium]